jgi:hypothetical protein
VQSSGPNEVSKDAKEGAERLTAPVSLPMKGGSMKAFVVALLLLAPAVGGASNISIGGVPLSIPNPQGFGPVTQQMVALYDLQKQFVAPTNEEYVAFIPEGYLAAALKGEIPDLTRRFTVQTAKSIVSASISSSDFVKLKNIIKSQNDDLMKKVEKDLPELIARMNKGIAKKYDVNLAFSISQMVPLPVHEETDRTLAYSAFLKYNMNDAAGNPSPYIAVFTTTFVHVKGKVLFLYCYAEEAGLEWSRESSKQWASAVVVANPSDFQSSVKESLPSAVTGIDWAKVGAKAIAGAIIGLIIGLIAGLIAWSRKRGKAS